LGFQNLFDGSPLLTLIGHSKPVLCHYLDDHKIVSGGEDRQFNWWELRTGKRLLTASASAEISSLYFDDSMMIAATRSGIVELRSMMEQKRVISLAEHHSSIDSIVVNGLNFISGSLDKSIKVWEIQRLSPSFFK